MSETTNKITPKFNNNVRVDEFRFEEIKTICNQRINMEFVYKCIIVICKDNKLEMTDNGLFIQAIGDNVNVFNQNDVYKTCFKGWELSKKDKKTIEQMFINCLDITKLFDLIMEGLV